MKTPPPLPHSDDHERGLLCSLCIDPAIYNELPSLPDGFWYWPQHRMIFQAIQTLLSKNDPLDYRILRARLITNKQLDEVGGEEYLTALWGLDQTSAKWRWYYAKLYDLYVRRLAIAECTEFSRFLYDVDTVIEEEVPKHVEQFFTKMALTIAKKPKVFREQVHLALDYLGEQGADNAIKGVQFGIAGLDNSLYGLQFSELCGIGALSSDGKSALLLNLACHAVGVQGIPTAIFSLEMPDIHQIIRILSAESRVEMDAFKRGRLTKEQDERFKEAVAKILPWKMHIEDSVNLTFDSFCSRCRALRVKDDVRLFGLDMISLLSVPRAERYDLALAHVIQGCKNLALELNSVVIVLTQLNKQLEAKNAKAIFEACDVYLRIVRSDDESETRKEILIEKNRMGRRGVIVPVTFDGAHMRFTDRDIGDLPDFGEPLKGYEP